MTIKIKCVIFYDYAFSDYKYMWEILKVNDWVNPRKIILLQLIMFKKYTVKKPNVS